VEYNSSSSGANYVRTAAGDRHNIPWIFIYGLKVLCFSQDGIGCAAIGKARFLHLDATLVLHYPVPGACSMQA
jgi:hypothetical protein